MGALDALLDARLVESFDEAKHPRGYHGRFKIGDVVSYRQPSIVNGKVEGHGPPQLGNVHSFQRNGYVRVREPTHGTTVDVHHSNLTASSELRAGSPAEARALRDANRAAQPIPVSAPAPRHQFPPGTEVQAKGAGGRGTGWIHTVEDHNPDGSVTVRDYNGEQHTFDGEHKLVKVGASHPGRSTAGAPRTAATGRPREHPAIASTGAAFAAAEKASKAQRDREIEAARVQYTSTSMRGPTSSAAMRVYTQAKIAAEQAHRARMASHQAAYDRARAANPRFVHESELTVLGALLKARLGEAFAPPANPSVAQSNAQGAQQVAGAQHELATRNWNASKHPRARGGKFGYTTGGARARKGNASTSRTLGVGANGALVRSIQKQLGIPADGVYGQQTRAAVSSYQRQHGLQVDGVVGRQTLAALRGHTNARGVAPGPIGSKSARVRAAKVPKAKALTAQQKAALVPARIAGGIKI